MKMWKRLWALGLAACLVAALAFGAMAASSGGGDSGGSSERAAESAAPERDQVDEIYARGLDLAKAGEYEDALKRFKQANKKRGKDPEILNMMAYCFRKLGNLEDAFEHYQKALDVRSDFPQAREYLGEAHIQAALLQVEILRGYGAEGEKELAELVAALQRAAAAVGGPEAAAPVSASDW